MSRAVSRLRTNLAWLLAAGLFAIPVLAQELDAHLRERVDTTAAEEGTAAVAVARRLGNFGIRILQ
jgi:hypothetical protein